MKIAKFKSLGHGYETVHTKALDGCDGYVRISEYVDVEFPPLADAEMINNAIVALDRRREKIVDEFTDKLAEIDQQKSELLAITHQPPSEVAA